MSVPLEALLEHPALWRGEACARNVAALPTGFAALDRCLPGGGWPQGALSELFPAVTGIGELTLLLPACARLTHAGRWVVFIAPPCIPYAPALADAGLELSRLRMVQAQTSKEVLWALEQSLRARLCGAALAWPTHLDEPSLRRLQLAAEQGGSSGFLFPRERALRNASTAALRLALAPADDGHLDVHVLKRRGGLLAHPVRIPLQELRAAASCNAVPRA